MINSRINQIRVRPSSREINLLKSGRRGEEGESGRGISSTDSNAPSRGHVIESNVAASCVKGIPVKNAGLHRCLSATSVSQGFILIPLSDRDGSVHSRYLKTGIKLRINPSYLICKSIRSDSSTIERSRRPLSCVVAIALVAKLCLRLRVPVVDLDLA